MKKSLLIALALMLVLSFATSAMAAQVLNGGSYLSTPTNVMYDKTASTTLEIIYGTPAAGKFVADGTSNYPYEIYIPNEKNPGAYRIHSNYAKNTDACASCHSTHTAVGDTLLQWYSTYETCMACHDGTVTTTYNVVKGEYITNAGTTFTAMGGVFGGTDTPANYASNHNVTGALSISAAPGGSTAIAGSDSFGGKRWAPTFGCESCHTPHGSGGNARILHPDANYTASRAAAKVDGYTVDAEGDVVDADGKEVYLIKGYPYELKITAGTKAGAAVPTAYVTNVAGHSQVVINGIVSQGTARAVYGTAALKVGMTITNYLSSSTNTQEVVAHNSGMNAFCGACHTDYNTADTRSEFFVATNSSDNEVGEYTKAHRHQVGVAPRYNDTAYGNKNELEQATMVLEDGKLECLTCHVAHGVSVDYWKKTVGPQANGGTGFLALADLEELSGSSALKRLPNMGTCEACHQKGDSAEGYVPVTGSDNGENIDYTPNTYNNLASILDWKAADLQFVGSAKCAPCHAEFVTGWTGSGHQESGHRSTSKVTNTNGGCAACHAPASSFIATGTFLGDALNTQIDAGISCEVCHGAGKNHIAAPSSKNILNPGTKDVLRQTIECGRCHDMYANKTTQVASPVGGNIKALSGTNALPVAVGTSIYTTTQMYDYAKAGTWSPAFRYAGDAPNNFVNATQLGAASSHYGGAWGYADSKHYLGTSGNAADPQGVVNCTTCHDMHSNEVGGLKFEYTQLCEACHGVSATLPLNATEIAQGAAMPQNAWNRHQLEFRDYAHSFKFGAPATIAAVDVTVVNIEKAKLGIAGSNDGTYNPILYKTQSYSGNAANTFYSVYDEAYGTYMNTGGHWSVTKATYFGEYNLFRGAQAGGGISFKVQAYAGPGQTNPVYNNSEMTWEYVSDTADAVVGDDFVIEPNGVVEFHNPLETATVEPAKSGAANYAANGTDYAKFTGSYTMKYTSKANSGVTGNVTFHIKPRPID